MKSKIWIILVVVFSLFSVLSVNALVSTNCTTLYENPTTFFAGDVPYGVSTNNVNSGGATSAYYTGTQTKISGSLTAIKEHYIFFRSNSSNSLPLNTVENNVTILNSTISLYYYYGGLDSGEWQNVFISQVYTWAYNINMTNMTWNTRPVGSSQVNLTNSSNTAVNVTFGYDQVINRSVLPFVKRSYYTNQSNNYTFVQRVPKNHFLSSISVSDDVWFVRDCAGDLPCVSPTNKLQICYSYNLGDGGSPPPTENLNITANVTIFLNSTHKNITMFHTEIFPVFYYVNSSGVIVNLTRNGTEILNNSNIFQDVGYYNYSATVQQNDSVYFAQSILFADVLADLTPPIFTTNPYNKTTTNQSVEISWTTDESANYTLTIGLCPSFTGINTFSNATFAATHNKWIDNLVNSTNYCVNVTVADSSNNKANANVSFTTAKNIDQLPPLITNLRNTSTTNQSSFIEWSCNENCNYTISWFNNTARTSEYLVGTRSNNTLALSHNPQLTGLLNSTTYYINLTASDSAGNKASNNTFSFITAANIVQQFANEQEGDDAILLGINTSEIWTATVYDSYQVGGSNLSQQFRGRFDKFAIKGNKRWAINYVSQGESAITGIFNITPTLYVLQLQDLSSGAITQQVGSLINSTYP